MSAVARELAYALQSHPSGPAAGATILLCIEGGNNNNNNNNENVNGNNLKDDLVELLDGHLNLEVIEANELLHQSEEGNGGGPGAVEENWPINFDAAICPNLFTGLKIVDNRQKVANILGLLLRSIRTGGVLILRENLAHWGAHTIAELTKLLDVFATKGQSQTFGFQFYGMCQLQDSIFAHSNFLDVFWTLTKSAEMRLFDDKLATFREFLDQTQYTEDNVASYEWIFGTDFISPGGIVENRRVLGSYQRLRPGQKMLDIGVGIGGGARQAAREFGLHVLGCDLSSNMIQHAFERNQRDKDHRVQYRIADAMVFQFEPNSFDIVFSRDCIQHIQDTKKLFQNIHTWLKPGGQVLVTMYGKGHGVLTPKFHEYVRKRQYGLKTLEEYREIAHAAGLTNILTENMTKRFREILVMERDKAVENREEFIQKFSETLYEKLLEGWVDKLQFIDDDNQNWLLLRAEKPVHP